MPTNIEYKVSASEIIDNGIEYKELHVEDFWKEEKTVGIETTKITLDLKDTEYLSDVIKEQNVIDYDESNTVAINCSLGQGKSYLAIEIAKKYYLEKAENNKPKYTVIFAVPHKSLIEQYISDVKDELHKANVEINIPDYANLVEIDDDTPSSKIMKEIEKASSERMHIFTINCLLGNPGDDAVEQGFVKRSYLEKIISINKQRNRKVIIILDEIHDSIHNFKQDLIFNLWKFRTQNVLHKTFILSATFNEASKVVIKYIAELTHKKLQIIESLRKQQIKELSNLHIHLTKSHTYDFDSNELVELFEPIIENHQSLNILSYSKRLCSRLIDGTDGVRIRDLLVSKFGENINICIPEQDHLTDIQKKNKGIPNEITYSSNYIKGKCNIGTTFKTGVSIKEQDSAYVIILPSKYSMQGFVKSGDFGIFTNGIISLIQALARVRTKSDIYIIMPYPNQFIQYPSIEDTYLEKLLEIDAFKYHIIQNDESTYRYHTYQDQEALMENHYKKIKERLDLEIKTVEGLQAKERESLPYLQYPTFEMYILSKGEKMLYSYYTMFGKDLSAYMIWGAFNNQFVNCKLKTISTTKPKKKYKVDNTQNFISEYFLNSYSVNWFDTKYSDIALYEKLHGRITSEIKILVKKKRSNDYAGLNDIILRRHIMAFMQKFTKGNRALNQKYMKFEADSDNLFENLEFSVGDYLLCAISSVIMYNPQNNKLTANSHNNLLIDTYLNLYEVYQMFISNDKMIMRDEDGKSYIYPKYEKYQTPILTEEEILFIIQTIKSVAKDVNFKIFRKFQKDFNNTGEIIKSIYTELRESFFYLTKGRVRTQSGYINVEFIEIKSIPTNRTGINLLYEYEFDPIENFENNEDYIEHYVDFHELNQPKQEDWGDIEKIPITEDEKERNRKLQELLDNNKKLEKTDTSTSTIEVLSSKEILTTEKQYEANEYYDGDVTMNIEEIDKTPISKNDMETNRKVQELLEELRKNNSDKS